MKKLLAILLLIAVACGVVFLTGCTKSDKNLLKVGSFDEFDYTSLTAAAADWTFNTSEGKRDSVFSISDGVLKISTSSAGWAQMTQSVQLANNAYYVLEYTYTAEEFTGYPSTEAGFDGFFFTILEDESFNTGENSIQIRKGTSGGKNTAMLYFKTTEAKHTTVALNVGSKDYPVNTAGVSIYSLKLTRVSRAVAKANASEAGGIQVFKSDTYNEMSPKNAYLVVLGAIAVALIAYFGYVMLQRHMHIASEEGGGYRNKFVNKLEGKNVTSLLLVAGATLFIRLAIDLLMTGISSLSLHATLGYTAEGYATQALFMGRYGTAFLSKSLGEFASDNGYIFAAIEATPLRLYLLTLIGLIARPFGSHGYLVAIFFVKFFASLADIGTALIIYTLLKKYVGNVGAVIMALTYSILPLTFGASAAWGYMESVTVFFVALTFYFLLKNQYFGVVLAFLGAFMFSYSAILIAPIVLFYSVQQFINHPKKRIAIIVAPFVAFGLVYALSVPFFIQKINAGKPMAFFDLYWKNVFTEIYYTINTFNFQMMLGNNVVEVRTESMIVTIIFIAFLLGVIAFAYFKYKNRMNLMLLTTAFINMLYVFGNGMTPLLAYASLVLMLLYAVINREKRIYFCFGLMAVLMFVNTGALEMVANYTLDYAPFLETDALAYVFSSFALLFALYYIYIVYDIVVSRKVMRIRPMTLTYGAWWKNLGLRIQKAYYKVRVKTASK